MQHVLTFYDDGTAGALYSDDLAPLLHVLGPVTTVRASDVEPDGLGWSASVRAWVPGGAVTLGPFRTRGEALAAEVAHLEVVL